MEIVEAERLRLLDQRTENALPAGQLSDRGVGLVVDPEREELLELRSGPVDDTEGRVQLVSSAAVVTRRCNSDSSVSSEPIAVVASSRARSRPSVDETVSTARQ